MVPMPTCLATDRFEKKTSLGAQICAAKAPSILFAMLAELTLHKKEVLLKLLDAAWC